MNKRIIFLCMVMGVLPLNGSGKNLQKNMNCIMNSYVDNGHKKEFSSYYKNFIEQQTKIPPAKREKALKTIRDQGKAALQVKDPNALKKSESWPQRKQVLLLTRCGAYEEFLQKKATQKLTVWYKFCCYLDAAKKRVAHGVNKIKSCYRTVT